MIFKDVILRIIMFMILFVSYDLLYMKINNYPIRKLFGEYSLSMKYQLVRFCICFTIGCVLDFTFRTLF